MDLIWCEGNTIRLPPFSRQERRSARWRLLRPDDGSRLPVPDVGKERLREALLGADHRRGAERGQRHHQPGIRVSLTPVFTFFSNDVKKQHFLMFRSWYENPAITTVVSLTHPVTKLDFPAVTVCTDAQYNLFGMTRMLLNMYEKVL